jgi:hypothetical protein
MIDIRIPKYKYGDNSILLEVYRGKMYLNLLQLFTSILLKYIKPEKLTRKKKLSHTISDIMAKWFFSQYSYYDFNNDSFFFTYNINGNKNLYSMLKDYNNESNSINLNIIISKLVEEYKKMLTIYNKYKNGDFYNNNKYNYKVSKKIIVKKRNNNNINFYKFSVNFYNKLNFSVKLENVLDNIILPVDEYNYIKTKFNGECDMDEIVFIILFRYQLLSSNNNQLAILPNVIDNMKKDYDLSCELFASGINSSTDIYCSLYYDVEHYFGSIGSFFNCKIISGVYTFNPPYQVDIIERGINKLLYFLNETNKDLTFFITIPIWDNYGKSIMNNKTDIDYGDFKIIDVIKKSKYMKKIKMISKENFTYMDHNYHLFKNITIQHTYIIVLSNTNKNFNNIDEYKYNM